MTKHQAPVTSHQSPSFECESVNPGLLVPDVAAAVAFYIEKLGFKPGWTWGDPPNAAGVKLGKVMVQMSKGVPVESKNWMSFEVTDVDDLFEFHKANGAKVSGAPEDKPWGIRLYQLQDLNGYWLEFGQILMPKEPALPIDRVDVPVRLERRLAAVLADLAKRKRMTIGETLEETLLHTFEQVDSGGVASPHAGGDFAHIQRLKEKHGIDYDCHASYRFKER
jgi:uncharacterized glyoxalase superfamily protein PhnB